MRPVLLHATTPDVTIRIDVERLRPMTFGVLKIGRLPRCRIVPFAKCAAESKLRGAVAGFELCRVLVRIDDVAPSTVAPPHAERIAVRAPRVRGVARRGGPQRRQIGHVIRRERGGLRVGLVDERLLDCFRGRHRQLREADDAVLVNREREGDGLQIQQIERIGQRGPADLLPLQEQARPIGMLILDDRHDGDRAVLFQLFETCVPHGHVHSAARSPGGEDVDDEFLAAKLCQRHRSAIRR